MEEIFITNIHINKVRHLENIEILLSETERKHLILTGKNGVGKTSVLEELKNNFTQFLDHYAPDFTDREFYETILSTKYAKFNEEKLEEISKRFEEKLETNFNISNEEVTNKMRKAHFVLSSFGAKRDTKFGTPDVIEKIEPRVSGFKGVLVFDKKDFVRYMVSLKSDLAFALMENDAETAKKINEWFENFENSLKDIFEDKNLKLEFDRENYNFNILQEGREPFTLNTLSDGYSAILSIVTDLIFRMENKKVKAYDIQGIAIIDEIETHLHLALQKKILPFLTAFFPKIQFIVSTHSPFVANSLENVIVFDLGTETRLDNAHEISYSGLVEEYFGITSEYADILENKVETFEKLAENLENLDKTQSKKLVELEIELDNLSPVLSTDARSRFRLARKKLFKPSHD